MITKFMDTPQAVGSILGASLALFGVLTGLIWNGWLAERRIKDERNHEVRAIRTMIVAELKSLIKIVEGELDYLKHGNFTWVPILDFLSIYRSKPEKIALLTLEEASAISDAYYAYQESVGYIARKGGLDLSKPYLGTNAPIGFSDSAEDQSRKAELVGDLNKLLPPTQSALFILEKQ